MVIPCRHGGNESLLAVNRASVGVFNRLDSFSCLSAQAAYAESRLPHHE